jgi:hypothetical protein
VSNDDEGCLDDHLVIHDLTSRQPDGAEPISLVLAPEHVKPAHLFAGCVNLDPKASTARGELAGLVQAQRCKGVRPGDLCFARLNGAPSPFC